MLFEVIAREHKNTLGTLAREHISTQGTLAREHVSTQGTFVDSPKINTGIQTKIRTMILKKKTSKDKNTTINQALSLGSKRSKIKERKK